MGLLTGLGILYVSACGLVYSQQRQLIFKPSRGVDVTPAQIQLDYEEVWIAVPTDGNEAQRIHGWWIPAQDPKGTLLYLHGNGFNIAANLGLAQRFHRQGLSVLLIDYRGYGNSDGDFPSEEWVYDDAEAAWSYLRNDRHIPAEKIVVFGHSLGGAIAIDLVRKHPNAAGIIVQSSFSSMQDLAQLQGWPRVFPLDLLLTQRFDSMAKVAKLVPPKLLIHGSADALIPVAMSQQLYDASAEPKTIQVIAGAGHNNVAEVGGDRYDQLVAKFVTQTLLEDRAPALR
ncbi:alpha/beta hydrolase [Lyngbya confervoides]|uniref:Lysophospholipase n=1 Tax=Lyngbya confervoides BDU141951 TaxID=1574623 RepID=A0ABD4T798_9CYAN|nr:alpha/beta fold hydrolase [Lyngbya confervoides]MCM1984356.1 lysophospholipase [Lyngbya confervoides BDU141951]